VSTTPGLMEIQVRSGSSAAIHCASILSDALEQQYEDHDGYATVEAPLLTNTILPCPEAFKSGIASLHKPTQENKFTSKTDLKEDRQDGVDIGLISSFAAFRIRPRREI